MHYTMPMCYLLLRTPYCYYNNTLYILSLSLSTIHIYYFFQIFSVELRRTVISDKPIR